MKNALEDLQKAIRLVEFPPPQFSFRSRDEIKRNLAVMYHHRGLIYQKLEQADKAKDDFERAARWGYDPASGAL